MAGRAPRLAKIRQPASEATPATPLGAPTPALSLSPGALVRQQLQSNDTSKTSEQPLSTRTNTRCGAQRASYHFGKALRPLRRACQPWRVSCGALGGFKLVVYEA
jgi:hypothetical protein